MKNYTKIIENMSNFLLEEPDGNFQSDGRIDLYRPYDIEKMAEFSNKFDETSELTLCHLARLCQKLLESTSCPVMEALTATPQLEKYRKCLGWIRSTEVVECRKALVEKMSVAISALSNKKQIGEMKTIGKAVDEAVEALFESFANLHFEIYLNSGTPIGDIATTSLLIVACNSLAECLLRLEKTPDGIYVCYISNPGTLDGWFGFFVKSNGNLFSYHERIDEEYIGQHGNMRNGRYAENKAYDLFPYELCKASEETDYKGYAKEIRLGDQLHLMSEKGDDISIVIRMLLSMAVIARKHGGKPIEGEPVLVNSLLPHNIALLADKANDTNTTAVVEWKGSPIVEYTAKSAVPVFEAEKVLNGEYNKEFDEQDGCYFNLDGQDVVDAYGKGFAIKQDEILKSDSSLRLIGNGECEQEFIGSLKRLRTQAYYEVRKQLRKYLENKMECDFRAFGGKEKLGQWYREHLESRKDAILKYCLEAFDDAKTDEEGNFFGSIYLNSDKDKPEIDSRFDKEHPIHAVEVKVSNKTDMGFWGRFMLSTPSKDRFASKRLCWLTGSAASYYFRFDFYDYHQVQDFLGCELPKFCIGWTSNGWRRANNILNIVDPVSAMILPLKHYGNDFSFDFVVALSKSGLNKIRRNTK